MFQIGAQSVLPNYMRQFRDFSSLLSSQRWTTLSCNVT